MQRFALALALTLAPVAAPAGRADDPPAQKPSYTDVSNGGDIEVEYVLDSVKRAGREVTFVFDATLTKGKERETFHFFSVNAVDAEGKAHKGRINDRGTGRTRPEVVVLNAGVKRKVTFRAPLDRAVTRAQSLEFTASAVERPAIRLFDVEIPM